MAACQAALQRGQYTHPTGLFYGGSRPSWSLSTLGKILTEHLGPACRRLAPSLKLSYLALEFGTRPIAEVLAALRADAWLHAVPDRPTPHREAIRRQVRDAFLIDSPAWRAAIYGRCADGVLRACRGLGG